MRRYMVAAVAVLALAGCSAPAPASTAPTEPSQAPSVDVGIGVVTSEQAAGLASHQRSQHALLSFTGTGDADLITMDAAGPLPLFLTGVDPDETIESNSWVLEQDDAADVVAADFAVLTIANSGLNATPAELRIFAFDGAGNTLAPVTVAAETWGDDGAPSTDSVVSLTMVGGVGVLVTQTTDGYAMVGIDIRTGALLWRNASDDPGHLTPCPMVVPTPSIAISCFVDGVTAVDPRSGAVIWTTDAIDNFDDIGSSRMILGGEYPPGSGTRIDKLVDAQTGAVLAEDFDSGAYDTVTGDYTLSNMSHGNYVPEGRPALQVIDQAGDIVYELDAAHGEAVGGLFVLGAYDGRTWLTTRDGIDIVVSRTGDRDAGAPPIEQAGGEPHWIPTYSTPDWIAFESVWSAPAIGLQFEGFRLIRHPGTDFPFEQLPLL